MLIKFIKFKLFIYANINLFCLLICLLTWLNKGRFWREEYSARSFFEKARGKKLSIGWWRLFEGPCCFH